MSDDQQKLRSRSKSLGKRLLALMPFVRRSRHKRALARMRGYLARMQRHVDEQRKLNEELGSLLLWPPTRAIDAVNLVTVPFKSEAVEELCLFVTHAPAAELKPHVIDHVTALLDRGIATVLIANADVELASLRIPDALAGRLHGCLVRQNVGFDFAAWSHAYCLLPPAAVSRRLLLVNDSIVGPTELAPYDRLLERIRSSGADLIGLTSNPDPHPHLQSFYLVFGERLLRAPISDAFLRGIVNLPHKQNVIDCYEIWLTRYVEEAGFSSAALFPNFSKLPAPRRNDTQYAWKELLAAGFPFIKSIVVRDPTEGKAARALLPARYT